MKVVRIGLQPHSRFHFGEFKTDNNVALASTSSFMHSDTLFSALINTYSELKGNAEDFIDDFTDDKLSISSLFYYIKKGSDIIYLLPKPTFLDIYSTRDGQHKKRNRIQWLSLNVWKKGLDGNLGIISDEGKTVAKLIDDYVLIQNDSILISKNEASKFSFDGSENIYSIKDRPKNARRGKEDVFYETDIEIGNIQDVEIGFYFMFNVNEGTKNKLITAINLLKYSGIGGEKSNLGNGINNIEEDIISFVNESDNYEEIETNISLIIPKDTTELNAIEYSKTVLRGGSGDEKNQNVYDVIRMIKEGAELKKHIIGDIAEIGKDFADRKVYRYGKAFIIPAYIKKLKKHEIPTYQFTN